MHTMHSKQYTGIKLRSQMLTLVCNAVYKHCLAIKIYIKTGIEDWFKPVDLYF